MVLYTKRLVLRPWKVSDAADLYEYAKDERIGPIAGWPVHQSIEESEGIIKSVFIQREVYAVTLKENNRAIGCIGLLIGNKSNFPISENEGEIAYWIGVPFWGKGLIPEAIIEVIKHAFNDLKLKTLWCGYFDGNENSKRAQEKCGFCHHHTETNKFHELTNDIRIEHLSILTIDKWKKQN